jgi:purine nucleosidase
MKVVLDMDPRIDDGIALLLTLNDPAVHVLEVTTVSGNVNVSKATLNALIVMKQAENIVHLYTKVPHDH